MTMLTRRHFAAAAATVALWPTLGRAQTALPPMTVTKDPNCGCCQGWIDHVKANGFSVQVVDSSNLTPLKQRLGVPEALQSCHTAEISGYVIEGHVPAPQIRRLLMERPQAVGLAVAGMPAGAPGMEMPGMSMADMYEVTLFGASGQRPFARYRGKSEVGS